MLQELNIPASVTSIADVAIVSCPLLQAYHVAEGNANYMNDENGVLYDITGSTLILYPNGKAETSYTIPPQVTKLAPYALAGALRLEELTIPETVREIGTAACSNLHKLKTVHYPKTLTVLPENVFADCSALETFEIPDTVTAIGACAFMRCTSLRSIDLPASVKTVGDYAYAGCSEITEITIPETVETIGECAFGFEVEFDESGNPTGTKVPGFVIHGEDDTAAKYYALSSGLTFNQEGFNKKIPVYLTCCLQ